MATEYLAKVLLHRFIWVQDFAARLAELGAPASAEVLLELGKASFETSSDRDAVCQRTLARSFARVVVADGGEWRSENRLPVRHTSLLFSIAQHVIGRPFNVNGREISDFRAG